MPTDSAELVGPVPLAGRRPASPALLRGVRVLAAWLLAALALLTVGLGSTELLVRFEPVTPAGAAPAAPVRIVADERLFTFMAALNAAGYDDENNVLGMHPVRQAVRADLAGLYLPSLDRLRPRLQMCRLIHESQCLHWLLQRGGPPDFARQAEGWWPDVPAFLFLGMDTALRDFYLEAGIARLWQNHQPAYAAEIARYQALLEPSLQVTQDYLGVSASSIGTVVMLPNLSDAYWRGYGLAVGDTSYIVSGPAETPNIGLLQHEYLHPIINPLVDANLTAIDPAQSRRLFAALRGGVARGYGSWEAILHESVIRAVQVRLAAPAEREWQLEKEESAGFWLVRPLAQQLEDYEAGDVSLAEYMPTLLAAVNTLQADRLGAQ